MRYLMSLYTYRHQHGGLVGSYTRSPTEMDTELDRASSGALVSASSWGTYGAVLSLLIMAACTKSEDATSVPSAREQAQIVQSSLALPPSTAPTPPADAMQPATGTALPADAASVRATSPMMRVLGTAPALTSTSQQLPHAGAAPHLFHLGAESFFLDHEELALTSEQRTMLSAIRETAVLGYATSQRKIDQAEQELWSITSAEHPSAGRVETKLAEIARLSARQRMDYILAIGQAVAHLTEAQHEMLTMPRTSAGGVATPPPMGSGSSTPMPMPMPPVDPMPMPVDPPMGGSGSAKSMGHM